MKRYDALIARMAPWLGLSLFAMHAWAGGCIALFGASIVFTIAWTDAQEYAPWPLMAVGVVLLLGGVVLYMRAVDFDVRNNATPR
jgi:hypothetical protein